MKLYFIQLFFLSLCFAGCQQPEDALSIIHAQPSIYIDSLPGQCPYLAKDARGHAVLSWVRMKNDSSFSFCYAVSADGKTFGKTVVIPGSENILPHSENLPKIIWKPSGEIIALWGTASSNKKNKYAGMVSYSQSFDEGKTWSKPKHLISDTSGYDQRYYDVALLPNGEAGIIWLDNRKTTDKEGSALYFASTTGKDGFKSERMISQPCCPCCRTDLFVDSKGGIHTLYRGIINDSIRDMLHTVSIDGGKTFSPARPISNDNWVIRGCQHTGPAMTENKVGLHFAWFTGAKKKGCFYTRSIDNGNNFSMHDSISASGSHPQIVTLANGQLLIAWDEGVQVNNKSVKRIAVQKRTAAGAGSIKNFITADTATATYPVLAPLDETTSFIAYSIKKGEVSYIAYQLLRF